MRAFFKGLIVPVATYAVLRGGEAVVSVIRKKRKENADDNQGDDK